MDPTEDINGLVPKELPAAISCRQGGPNSRSKASTDGQPRLVEILADMLRSALNWEEEHGMPLQKSPQRLTSQPRSVDCPTKATNELLGQTEGGPPMRTSPNQKEITFEDLKGLRAEGYVRDSTLDQRDGFGPDIQRNNILRFAQCYGLVLGDKWYTAWLGCLSF